MKKSLIVLISILALLVIIIGYGISINNKMVNADEAVMSQWAKVENQYQRRADLIPNLVNTVKGYASHEKETLDAVVNARAKATQVTISPDNLNEASLQKYQAAQGELSQALGRLLMVTENYPDLKANQNFLQLQEEVSDVENKLAAVRRYFNSATKEYNNAVQTFPSNIIAGMAGFRREIMFDLGTNERANLEQAPKISF